LLNLDAVCGELAGKELEPGDVQLLCSGTAGRPALEDIYVAGRIAARLPGSMSDAALASRAVAAAYPSARVALGASADAGALMELGLDSDVDWCARESVASVIPRVRSVHLEAGARHALVSASPVNADIDGNLTVSHNI
nr:2-phosphosulfolactate phosphatase [Solirubrobacterales bacterium]